MIKGRPLLKWVGGKRQLLPHLRRRYPADFDAYLEPFLGSGAVFFDLHDSGRLHGHSVVLIDSNADLIGCYESVRDDPDAVVRTLDKLAEAHARGGRNHYFDVRDRQFNPARRERRGADGRIAYTPELAAMLIYLNRTGFNGLYRVNAKGAFNVPPGRYVRPRIVDRARIFHVSRALGAAGVRLVCGGFDVVDALARAGDFLYIDPPYAPLTRTASFTAYTAGGFGEADQRALQRVVVRLALRGCHVLLSNSTAPEIMKLYDRDARARAAGLRSHKVAARRAVNSNASRRGPVQEYLITNIANEKQNEG
jgi:DNA adenine methylase